MGEEKFRNTPFDQLKNLQKSVEESAQEPKKEGFKKGKYVIHVTYPTHNGPRTHDIIKDVYWTIQSPEELEEFAGNEIGWLGLHNFGLQYERGPDRESYATLTYDIFPTGEPENKHSFMCKIKPNGHRIKPNQ